MLAIKTTTTITTITIVTIIIIRTIGATVEQRRTTIRPSLINYRANTMQKQRDTRPTKKSNITPINLSKNKTNIIMPLQVQLC